MIIDARCTRRWRERSIRRCIPLDSRIANPSSRGTRGRGGEEVQGLGGRSGGCGGGDGRGRKREEKRSLLTGPGTGRSNSRRFARCTSAALFLTAYTYMWRFQNKSVSRRNFVRTSRYYRADARKPLVSINRQGEGGKWFSIRAHTSAPFSAPFSLFLSLPILYYPTFAI